jgi:hypothetical protein
VTASPFDKERKVALGPVQPWRLSCLHCGVTEKDHVGKRPHVFVPSPLGKCGYDYCQNSVDPRWFARCKVCVRPLEICDGHDDDEEIVCGPCARMQIEQPSVFRPDPKELHRAARDTYVAAQFGLVSEFVHSHEDAEGIAELLKAAYDAGAGVRSDR